MASIVVVQLIVLETSAGEGNSPTVVKASIYCTQPHVCRSSRSFISHARLALPAASAVLSSSGTPCIKRSLLACLQQLVVLTSSEMSQLTLSLGGGKV